MDPRKKSTVNKIAPFEQNCTWLNDSKPKIAKSFGSLISELLIKQYVSTLILMEDMNQTVFCIGAKLLLIGRPLIGSTRFVPATFNDSKLFINENVIT